MHELNHEMFGSVTHIIAKVSKHMIGVSKHMFGNVTYYEKLVETLIKKYCDCLVSYIYSFMFYRPNGDILHQCVTKLVQLAKMVINDICDNAFSLIVPISKQRG